MSPQSHFNSTNEMTDIIEASFELNIQILKLVGLYQSEKRTVLAKLYAILSYFCFLILPTILISVTVFKQADDLNVAYATLAMSFWFKLCPFLKNGGQIRSCIHYFGVPKYAAKNHEERRLLANCIRVCRRNSKLFLSGGLSLAFMMCTQWLQQNRLPFNIWVPYDATSTAYYPSFVYLVICILYDASNCVIDPLIGGLAFHATTQLKILKFNLKNIGNCAKNDDFLRRCVDHHNEILDFIAMYEECFSFSIFSQFAGSLFSLCFLTIGTLTASSGSDGIEFFKFLGGAFAVAFQILFYCYYGTLLFEESDGFVTGIYMSEWYKCDVRVRKILILIMERSKIPIVITAGKVVNVTLQTFASVLKSSYSLIAVLNNF